MYVGVTDSDWYMQVREANFSEVNFWKPGTGNFKALKKDEMFLFKLHSPQDYIVGGGFFESFSILPTFLAWSTFKKANGVNNLGELNQRIEKYRSRNNIIGNNPQIGCILLTDCFYFKDEDWIPVPQDWKKSIVQGKGYPTDTAIGARLYKDITDRLGSTRLSSAVEENRFSYAMTKHRMGQGAFRIGVVNAYNRRCAISGEHTLPVLEAAHIKPVEDNGPYKISNGLLLRSDIHILFDQGYITVDDDYRINVSKRLHEDYNNGKDYYKFHGQHLLLPDSPLNAPSKEFLDWHNENVFIG